MNIRKLFYDAVAFLIVAILLWFCWFGTAKAAYSGPVTVTLPANAHVSTLSAPGEGGDYTEPNAWIADYITGKDLVSLDVTEVLQLRAGVYDFQIRIANDTATTDTGHRIIIMAYPGEECTGPTVGARIIWSDSSTDDAEVVQCMNDYTYVYNIGVSRPSCAVAGNCGGVWVGNFSSPGVSDMTGGGIYGVYAWDIRNTLGAVTGIELTTAGGDLQDCYVYDIYGTTGARGIAVGAASSCTASDSESYSVTTLTGSDQGVIVSQATNAVISRMKAHSVVTYGVNAADAAAAISVSASTGTIVRNFIGYAANAASGNGLGCLVSNAAGTQILNSTLSKNQIGCITVVTAATATNVASEQNTTLNWYAVAGGSWVQTTCTDGDGIQFVDADGGDFQLAAADTVARDQGTTAAGFTNDYLDVTRPQGSAWDIGAYEYPVPPQCFIYWIQ